MSEKMHRVEVFFEDEEYAILEELPTGIDLTVEKLVHGTVFRAHFT